jgi:hypothetical protein
MDRITIDLKDPTLFGNDVAEDENEDVFQSYAIHRPELHAFGDSQRQICITRAYKGEGKSALLRLLIGRIRSADGDVVIVHSTGNSLLSPIDSSDFATWLRGWKSAILARVASEVGARIGLALSDDDMSLVEEAEKRGFRSRSLISAVLERLRLGSIESSGVKVSGPEIRKPGVMDAEGLLKRWAQGRPPIWLIVDDVDQNFQNTLPHKAKAAAFFVACRELANLIPELRIRAAVRPNVWVTLKMEFEALSHVEQYNSDLSWSEQDIRQLLARRIQGYLARKGRWDLASQSLHGSREERDRQLISLVFDDPIRWGGKEKPPHAVLYTLSKHRPRWVIELSKLAAGRAVQRARPRIGKEDIVYDLGEFGMKRIQDTVAEFRSQCPEVEELISGFAREREQLTTDQLITIIERKILSHLKPRIGGVIGDARAMDVAAFLFQIGFIFGRRDYGDGNYDHIAYSERPSLLRSRSDIDAGLSWEIHPVFRQALEIRDLAGRETRRSGDKEHRGRG